jgi:photosystem II stability/assembly factor-like uncharacterized protein
VVTWKSVDGGKSWNAFRGAPGGDDYHRLWINPDNPDIILIASDQGAIITVNGGQTFSSWYNQPTAQFYHVNTDNDFPYNVYGGQQESGSVGIASRGNDGQITFREWHPVGVEEYGYVAPDPLDPDIIYGGKITKYNKRTGQVQNIAPEAVRGNKYRFLRTEPVIFSPVDKKTLFYAGNVLFKTTDGGSQWTVISPDLSRASWDVPESVGIYNTDEVKKMARRGVIYTIAPSFKDINTIWCGTDDGLIHVTKDGGKNWTNVTPASITSWSKISLMDAGHFDVNTAYAAVNRIRCNDMRAHIYKTHDGGKTWTEIVNGLPDDPINVVREDPQVPGLLYAGSERFVYVSLDDGAHWQSIRLNMPATSIRDLVIKDNDIVVGTHGRGFWILDDITPLRQLRNEKGAEGNILFKPATTYRIRWNMNTDTPLPQEEPAGENPPDGAIINYFLKDKASSVTLTILDASGHKVREYSNNDTMYKVPAVNIPLYWIRPQQILSAEAGAHRFLWDLHYEPIDVPPAYPIAAIYQNTAPEPTSPWVMPGEYIATLTVDGKSYKQTFTVRMDPRVKTGAFPLQQQFNLSMQCYNDRRLAMKELQEIRQHRTKLKELISKTSGTLATQLQEFDKQLAQWAGAGGGRGRNGGEQEISFGGLSGEFGVILNNLQESDMPPTFQAVKAAQDAHEELQKLISTIKGAIEKQLPSINQQLKSAGQELLE